VVPWWAKDKQPMINIIMDMKRAPYKKIFLRPTWAVMKTESRVQAKCRPPWPTVILYASFAGNPACS
jgi:hypothetical protein